MRVIGSPGRTGQRIGLAAFAATPVVLAAAAARDGDTGGTKQMAFKDERGRIAHLLRRAGFGAGPAELDAAASRGYDATLDQLLTPQDDHDAADDVLNQVQFDLNKTEDAQRWWILRMRYTSRPLVEKMALFWHGHFATAVSKVGARNLILMRQQNDLFRSQGMGSFADLLLNISKDPAMLIWLDGRLSHKNSPNENYGRELMELFTLGIGNYSEDDVKAAARAFTGWTVNRELQYVFNANDHDGSPKTCLGQSGSFNGDDIVRVLVAQQSTAKFLATKLARFFVSDSVDAGLVNDLASTYMSSKYDMRAVLRTLFKSDAFSSANSYHSLIKSPAEFVAGSLRSLDVQTSGEGLPAAMRAMGQELFNPPNVAGWPGGPAWIATNTVLARANLANALASATKPESGYYVDLSHLLNLSAGARAGDLLDSVEGHLVDGDLTEAERATLTRYLGVSRAATLDLKKQDVKIRGALYLTLTTAAYSLN